MTKPLTVKGNAFNDPTYIYDLQATAVPITWLYRLRDVLKTVPDNKQAKWLLDDVTELLTKLDGCFNHQPGYEYTVTMKRPDGTIHDETLVGSDDDHAAEEALHLWLDDEECIAVKRGELIPEEEPKRIIWVK